LQRAAENVDSFVAQGYLTSDEGETVRQLSEIDRRVERGEIDADEARSTPTRRVDCATLCSPRSSATRSNAS
jgi:polyhydroxyalkanoate synthesis regulator phasin